MKKLKMAMAVGMVALVLSACADGLKEPEENHADPEGGAVEIFDGTDAQMGLRKNGMMSLHRQLKRRIRKPQRRNCWICLSMVQ